MKPSTPLHFSKSPLLRVWLLLLITVLLTTNALRAQSASPLVIPFQGQITNQQNALVATGQYSIIFNLYDVAVGGQPLWTERHSKVGVVNGMVNVFLGSITSLAAVDFSQTRYLGITVDVDDKPTTADPEMVPRQMIIPAFHAKKAEKMMAFDASSGQSLGTSFGWSALFSNGDPASGTIAGSKLTSASITATQIASNAITTAKLADSSVNGIKIVDGSIGTADIANGAVTFGKLAPRAAVGTTGVSAGDLVYSASSGTASFGNNATTFTISNQVVTFVAGGGPVFFTLVPAAAGAGIYINGGAGDTATISLVRDLSTTPVTVGSVLFKSVGNTLHIPPGVVSFLDQPTAGSHTYDLRIQYTGGGVVGFTNVRLLAIEH